MTSDEAAKTENEEKRSSEKRKTPVYSFIWFCVGVALSVCVVSLLFGYDFVDMFIDLFGLPDILFYAAIGGGLLLAHILTRKPRKRTSRDSLEHKSKE